jgi:hypothetical protein
MATKHDNIFTGFIALAILVAVCLMLSAVRCHASEWEPAGFNTWKDGKHYVTDIGGVPQNYQRADSVWEQIDTTWQSIGDTLFVINKAVITCAAWPDGVSEVTVARGADSITLRRTLDRFILIDTLTWDRYDLITDIPLSNFNRHGRTLTWNFPGGNYRLKKDAGRTAAQVLFKKAFLDSICTVYDKVPLDSITTMVDSLYWDEEGDSIGLVQIPVITTLPERVAFGTVFKYEIVGVSDSLMDKLEEHPGMKRKKLFQFGQRLFSITSHRLHFAGDDNLPKIPIYQEWRKAPQKARTFYLCEYLMMWQLDSLHTVFPNREVWHGATESIEDIGVADAYIASDKACYNYGASVDIYVGSDPINEEDTLGFWAARNIAAQIGVAGATINSCSLYIPVTAVDAAGDFDLYRLFKYAIEGEETADIPDPDSGMTWVFFQGLKFRVSACNGYYWTQDDALPYSGPSCADDDGVDNVENGGTCVSARADRTETYMSTNYVNASSQYWAWSITTSLAQDWYDGDAAENGVIMYARLNGSIKTASTETTGDINGSPALPYFRFRYTVAEAAGQVIIID